jgi:exodeoxyribonuclease V beta subunit
VKLGPRHFDVLGPLPEPGVTVLEASAGTGKTYTIAALVARLVADGAASLSEILVVTFTRMATGELRDRVRERLVSAERGLGRALDAGEKPSSEDAVLGLLGEGGTVATSMRRQRLKDALANFDSATITTTHGFCHMVLAALGVWGDVADGADLLEDPTDLVEEVVDDLFTRHVLISGALPFKRKLALSAGQAAVSTPDADLDPAADRADGTSFGLLRRLGEGVRHEVEHRLLDANLLTYDDLLVRLARTLGDPERGPTACLRLRERYRVVLVDEFQDTDPVQWEIVRRAFGGGFTTLVLIGDPKQAVYSFRGADVYAYLEAARATDPERRFTLEQNWRSDAGLLESYDALLSPLHLGHPEIIYRRAHSSPTHRRSGLQGAPVPQALRARLVQRGDRRLVRTRSGHVQKDSAVKFVAEDLAIDVVELLASEASLVAWDESGSVVSSSRRVGPGDLGVLVRTNRQAAIVQAALRSVGVPVVVAGAMSVFSTPAARDWLRLLEAFEQPASRSLAVAAALTPFFGMTSQQLAGADEGKWESLHARLHQWGALMRRSGVATLFGHVNASEGLPARLLGEVEGERLLTDLGHVGELLHAEATESQLGLAALRAWLARRINEASPEGTEADQRSRRLDSDSDAVQILTVHRAKGLEFPIVYCPYLWDPAPPDRFGGPVVFHDPAEGERRKLDVGGERGDRVYEAHFQASRADQRGEDLRHLYVALTRAKHQTVIWWAGARDSEHSALGRLLMARDAAGDVEAEGRASEAKDPKIEAELRRRGQLAPGLVSVERCSDRPSRPLPPRGEQQVAAGLGVASFGRQLDLNWRRSSYTSIASGTHGNGPFADGSYANRLYGTGNYGSSRADELVGSEPEEPGTNDEPGHAPDDAAANGQGVAGPGSMTGPAPMTGPGSMLDPRAEPEATLRAAPSLLSAMAAGTDVGTFVHKVLERVDFSAPDLASALSVVIEDERARYPGSETVGDTAVLVSGLEAAISTSLGRSADGARLRDLQRRHRLDELGFELPLVGGDEPAGKVLVADIAGLFAEHIAPESALAGYATRLSAPHLAADLRGYLTGSLDLVFRLEPRSGARQRAERYFVADYKTNRLAGEDEELSAWHYRPVALAAEMRRAHYPLQALLYLVALHRYLRWRLPGYDPSLNLGGALYLFLRGMACPGAPAVDGQPCGVFAWCPPPALVTGLSNLLAGSGAS